MRAVNLVPEDARRGRGGSRSGPNRVSSASLGPAQVVVGVLLIMIGLVALRVLADNHVNDEKATLAALQTQVASGQAKASELGVYNSFVQAAQQREAQVREIAEQRFPWQRTLGQISRVMPATTSLSSLSATTSGSSTTTTGTTGTTSSGPTFTLAGCANTPNQNGVATLLRRLQVLSGVTNVGFETSTRQASCGNSFSLVLSFAGAGADTTAGSSTSAVAGSSTPTTAAASTTGTAGG